MGGRSEARILTTAVILAEAFAVKRCRWNLLTERAETTSYESRALGINCCKRYPEAQTECLSMRIGRYTTIIKSMPFFDDKRGWMYNGARSLQLSNRKRRTALSQSCERIVHP